MCSMMSRVGRWALTRSELNVVRLDNFSDKKACLGIRKPKERRERSLKPSSSNVKKL